MIKQTRDRRLTDFFSTVANDLVYDQKKLIDFIQAPFSLEAFEQQISLKSINYNHSIRDVLVDQLVQNYTGNGVAEDSLDHVKLLKDKQTFTVTTGHQLNLFTGPLYVIYKALHVIRLAEELSKRYPTYNFVPVFWMASEDHDFDEINHFHLFNQTYSWKSQQDGAVGHFDVSELNVLKEELIGRFENNQDMQSFIERHYTDGDTLSAANFKLMHELFGDRGLVILDADNPALKKIIQPILSREIESQFSGVAVADQTNRLTSAGYKSQVHPREINLFYLEKGSRLRIIKESEDLFIVGDRSFTKSALLKLVDEHPARFSPNVVLRPVYQEYILPNLTYVGGGGEMAYWLQLKGVFDDLKLTFPLIQVRNSIQLLEAGIVKKMNKLGLTLDDLFKPLDQVKKEFVLKHSNSSLDFSALETVGDDLAQKMEQLIIEVDSGLKAYSQSEVIKFQKQLEGIKSKMIRHQKKKHEDAMNQLDNLFAKVFPNSGLQERYENIIYYLAKYGKEGIFNSLNTGIDPLEKDLIILMEEV